MFAQWCFTAWNVAIGRPNCSPDLGVLGRLLGALAGDAGRLGGEQQPGQVGEHLAGRRAAPWPARRVRVSRAARRAGSRLAGTSALTPPPAVSTTSTSSPAPTSSTSARCPLEHHPGRAVRGAVATVTSPPSATAPIAEPLARPGSRRACDVRRGDRGEHRAGDHRTARTARAPRPGRTPRPPRPARAGRSRIRRAPRAGAARASPARASSAQKSGSSLGLRIEQRPGGGAGAARGRNSDTVWASARCSSVMAIDMS